MSANTSDPAPATMTATTSAPVVRRHPVRGILWGLLMGVGATVVLVVTKVIELDLTMMIVVIAIAIFVGVLWSTIGPAKAAQGPPPTTVTVSQTQASSRFDDFDPPSRPNTGSDRDTGAEPKPAPNPGANGD